eukprot:Nitzschia sp. Nitz4//scaffold20_size174350//114078//115436//NITZ4_002114-RA/size174350-snap-gene-0.220-mRNA-1//1//CDS//3329541845//8012//frame0
MPRRKPRGSRGERLASQNGKPSEKKGNAYDLMVSMPTQGMRIEQQLQVQEIMSRLCAIGYSHMALTHTVYGRITPPQDMADVAIPTSVWSPDSPNTQGEEPSSKKQRRMAQPSVKVLRRLHCILENQQDVSLFMSNSKHLDLLEAYDIVSVAPRNEMAFQAACASASVADIITLDYAGTRGLKVPFKIRSADVDAVMQRNAAFEISLAPALLNPKLQRSLVQTCRDLQTASLGKKPKIIVSSGNRVVEEEDAGAMALRTPGDLANLLQVLLHFDPSTAHHALDVAPAAVLERSRARRFGSNDIAAVHIGEKKEETKPAHDDSVDELVLPKDTGIPSEPAPPAALDEEDLGEDDRYS